MNSMVIVVCVLAKMMTYYIDILPGLSMCTCKHGWKGARQCGSIYEGEVGV